MTRRVSAGHSDARARPRCVPVVTSIGVRATIRGIHDRALLRCRHRAVGAVPDVHPSQRRRGVPRPGHAADQHRRTLARRAGLARRLGTHRGLRSGRVPRRRVLPARRRRRLLLSQRVAHPDLRRAGARAVRCGDGRTVLRDHARHPAVRGRSRATRTSPRPRRSARPSAGCWRRPRWATSTSSPPTASARSRCATPAPTSRRCPTHELYQRYLDRLPDHRVLFGHHIFTTYMATVPLGIISGRGDGGRATRPGHADHRRHRRGRLGGAVARHVGHGTPRGGERRADGAVRRRRRRRARSVAASSTSRGRRAFADAFSAFVHEFGSRGPNEWEIRSPTWETRPELALSAIDRMRLAPDAAAPAPSTPNGRRHERRLAPELLADGRR